MAMIIASPSPFTTHRQAPQPALWHHRHACSTQETSYGKLSALDKPPAVRCCRQHTVPVVSACATCRVRPYYHTLGASEAERSVILPEKPLLLRIIVIRQ